MKVDFFHGDAVDAGFRFDDGIEHVHALPPDLRCHAGPAQDGADGTPPTVGLAGRCADRHPDGRNTGPHDAPTPQGEALHAESRDVRLQPGKRIAQIHQRAEKHVTAGSGERIGVNEGE